MRWQAIAVWLGLVCAFVWAPASAAFAHATLIASDPADGAMVAATPAAFTLVFNEPVSVLVLRLIGPDGRAQLLPNPEGRHERLTISVPAVRAQGTHVLSWRVISLDGHPVGGTVAFAIGAPGTTAPAGEATSDPVVVASLWLAKIVIYLGLFVGIGGAFFAAWIAQRPTGTPRLAATTLVAGIVAAVLATGLQGLDALDVPLSALASTTVWRTGAATSFGITVIIAVAALAVALAGIMMRSRFAARAASLAGLIGVGLALALSGHASAAAPEWLTRPAVFVHGVAVAFWIGALAPLASVMRDSVGAATLTRFSRSIPWALGALIVSGLILAVVQIQHPAALLTTAYGQILAAKLALVAALIAIAAWNRYRATPAVIAGARGARARLRHAIAIELAIAVGIFGLVASWRFTPPPRVLAIAAARPALLHIHTGDAMADVRFEPGRAGIIRASIVIMTVDFGGLDAKEVRLTLAHKAGGVEGISRQATKGDDAVWRVEQLPVPLDGRWDVRLDILVDDFRKITLEGAVDLGPARARTAD